METLNATTSSWSIGQKLLFRFTFVYLILYALPFPLTLVYEEVETLLFQKVLLAPVKGIAHLFFKIPDIEVLPNGSGDTTFNYIHVLLLFLTAFVSSVLWTLLDRKRTNDRALWLGLVVFIRYYLGAIMLVYGFAKIFKTQFPFPSIDQLLKPYGEASPMNLLWTFMGYSTTYNYFTGFCEVAGGMLLFFRRTTLLDALIIASVMLNVVVLNFSYDVPVKLYSTHLFLMAIFLMTPDMKRLWNFFVLQRHVEARQIITPYKSKRTRLLYYGAKGVLLAFVLYINISNGLKAQKQWGDKAPKPVLYGVYDVDRFILKNDTVPPYPSDNRRWKRLVIPHQNYAKIQYMDDAVLWSKYSIDTLNHQVKISQNDSVADYHFKYANMDDGMLLLQGTMAAGDSLKVLFRPKDVNNFLLVNRGFHWINEYPFNR